MTHREMRLVGQMMSAATQADGSLNERVAYARKLRDWMAGTGEKP
jgi:hypothetical protein